jgi:hypothetical protein
MPKHATEDYVNSAFVGADGSVTSLVSLTQIDYNALTTVDPTTLYVLTDTGTVLLGDIIISGSLEAFGPLSHFSWYSGFWAEDPDWSSPTVASPRPPIAATPTARPPSSASSTATSPLTATGLRSGHGSKLTTGL